MLRETSSLGSSLRFQPSCHCTNSPSPKRQEATIMRCKGQIPGEATRGFSCRQRYLAQGSAKGGKRGNRIEPANQERITTASDPAVSPGNDGQEEEQATGCLYGNDGIQSQVRHVAPQPCESGATHPSAHLLTALRTRSPTHAVPGLACRQPDLRQTPHALSPYAGRSAGAAWAPPPDCGMPQAIAFHERGDSGSPPAIPVQAG